MMLTTKRQAHNHRAISGSLLSHTGSADHPKASSLLSSLLESFLLSFIREGEREGEPGELLLSRREDWREPPSNSLLLFDPPSCFDPPMSFEVIFRLIERSFLFTFSSSLARCFAISSASASSFGSAASMLPRLLSISDQLTSLTLPKAPRCLSANCLPSRRSASLTAV